MGIIADFSEWQGTIDWVKVSALHQNGTLVGVILRVQHGYTHPDSRYHEYVSACKQYGIPFGTYAYAAPVSVNDAIAEADSALKLVDPESKCFAIDIEEKDCPDIVAAGQAFVDHLKQGGIKNVGIYSGKNFYDSNNLAAIKADWEWIAAYGMNDGQPHNDPNELGEVLWQFTSTAHLDGVNTNVDENQEKGFTFFTPSTPVVVQAPVPAPEAKPIGVVTVICNALNLRTGPSTSASIIRELKHGEAYLVWANQNGWYNLGGKAWCSANPAYVSFSTSVAAPVYHTVVSGDTVSGLAAHFGSTAAQIKSWNNLDGNYTIYVGKSIRVK